MYKNGFLTRGLFASLILIIVLLNNIGCNEEAKKEAVRPKVPTVSELLLGSWTRYSNRVHALLIVRANGNWTSDLRVEGATAKIVERKGESNGTWLLEDDKKLIINVISSKMEDIWPTGTIALEIVEIDKKHVTFRYPNARLITWKKARVDSKSQKEGAVNPIIIMKPVVVNLNKLSSNDKDRYLCLALKLHLEEMELDAVIPKLHPRAWDAAIIYLSSLFYNDVKTFDEMKIVNESLTKILNPYIDGLLEEAESTHVMVSSSMEKVDEFIIEHSPPPALENPEAAQSEEEKDKEEEKNKEKEKK
ncbi:MAG: flagellar basal body-associated FliL family protein [Desulfamplus sp.]|nr:flagellar basal body-associated FliL family protein [Desulfamplus sp.]